MEKQLYTENNQPMFAVLRRLFKKDSERQIDSFVPYSINFVHFDYIY